MPAAAATEQPKPRGRPRSQPVRQAILAATLDLLKEVGYGALTIEAVAHRARCGKATIYRWWRSKANLVMEAYSSRDAPVLPFPDTGSVREDFRRQMQFVAELFQSGQGKLLAVLIGYGQEDEDLAAALRKHFIEARRSEALVVLHRALRRGEIRAGVFPDLAFDALYGPLFFRLLAGPERLTPDYVDALCDLVMGGLVQVE